MLGWKQLWLSLCDLLKYSFLLNWTKCNVTVVSVVYKYLWFGLNIMFVLYISCITSRSKSPKWTFLLWANLTIYTVYLEITLKLNVAAIFKLGWEWHDFDKTSFLYLFWRSESIFEHHHSPRKVLEMNSDTWFPERLISDRWVSSLFNILLNWTRYRDTYTGGWGRERQQRGTIHRYLRDAEKTVQTVQRQSQIYNSNMFEAKKQAWGTFSEATDRKHPISWQPILTLLLAKAFHIFFQAPSQELYTQECHNF